MWFSALLVLVAGALTSANGQCTTPKNEDGECIPLIDCKGLLGLLKKRPVNPTDIVYLQKSTCDVSSSEPKVCCPKSSTAGGGSTTNNPPVPDKTTQPTPTTATTVPTIDNISQISTKEQNIRDHKNFGLIPNLTECGKSAWTDKIIGGQDAGLGMFPWMALLGFQVEDDPVVYACGGSLINSRYVLTAAHCVTNLPAGYKLTTIRLGEYDQTKDSDCEKPPAQNICAPPVQDMEIDKIMPHEEYDKKKSKENDIALIRLKKNAALGPFVSPVCLPVGEKTQKTSPNSKVMVAGWGRLAYDAPESAPILQVVTLPIVSIDACNKFYGQKQNFEGKLDEGRFCAGGEDGKDSCKGDSGGPLMMPMRPAALSNAIRIYQLGVVSLGPSKCGHAGQPALYSRVSYFLPWMLDHMSP